MNTEERGRIDASSSKRNRIKKKEDDFLDYKGLTKSINGMTYPRLSASLSANVIYLSDLDEIHTISRT